MSINQNISHQEASERSYVAAAHREDRKEEDRIESLEHAKKLHVQRTGTELHEDLEKKESGPEQPGLAETEEGRRERSFIAAAHRDGREEDKKLDSLHKASELHEQRTGEPLEEAIEKGAIDDPAKEHKEKLTKGTHDQHLANQERSLLGAAHRKGRDEEGKLDSLDKANAIHKELTGKPLEEAKEKGLEKDEAKEDAHLEHQERAFIAAAHRKGRDEEGKAESLLKASEIHEERTGEPLPEAVEKGLVDEDGDALNANGKRAHETEEESHKRIKLDASGKHADQPGLAESAPGRQERAFIAAAHRDGRTEEAKLESLRKANEIHEKRTGQPLVEAVERGIASQ